MNIWMILVSVATLTCAGLICLTFPHKFQTLAIDYYQRTPHALRIFYFGSMGERYLRSNLYVIMARIIGFAFIGMAAIVAAVSYLNP